MTTEVSTTTDIRTAHDDISGRDAETAARLLEDGADAVVWVKNWLVDEKALDYAPGDAQVAAGSVDATTDKAWQVDGVWVPKSQAEVFELADGVERVESQQARLGDV